MNRSYIDDYVELQTLSDEDLQENFCQNPKFMSALSAAYPDGLPVRSRLVRWMMFFGLGRFLEASLDKVGEPDIAKVRSIVMETQLSYKGVPSESMAKFLCYNRRNLNHALQQYSDLRRGIEKTPD